MTALSPSKSTETVPETMSWSTPAVDVFEGDNEFVFLADLPGVSPEEVSLSLHQGVLSLEASAGEHSYRRRFDIEASLDSEALTAELHNGVLEVRLSKQAPAEPKKIQIQVSS